MPVTKRLLLLPILILLGMVLSSQTLTAAEPPNVVMIISDDQMWTDFGFMGHETIETPNLDQLARDSAVFKRGYVPSSLCRPSLMTMITGLYPHQHMISGNDPPGKTDRNLMLKHVRDAKTLPKLLKEKGYVSFQTGKWWEGNYSEGGFDAGMTHGDVKRGGRHGDEGLDIGRKGMEPIEQFLTQQDVKGEKKKPFFIWYAPFLPHTPHNPPERLLKKYQAPDRPEPIAKYYAMCEWFDETCGELLKIIDEHGETDNTLVLFVTDNGWIQMPNGRGYAPKSKRSPYDGGTRTPIMVMWPGHVKPGEHDDLVNSIDLAPTVLAAAGVKAPEDLPGINLLDVAAGKPNDRDTIFGEIFEHDVADIDDPAKSLMYRWVIQENWKLILPNEGYGKVQLYDLSKDPHETENLAAAKPDMVDMLTKKINAWWDGK